MLTPCLLRCNRQHLQRNFVLHLNRHFSVLPSSQSAPKHSIYISQSTDPYFNLTFEDWLFRNKTPEEPLLFLYRDDPCVVIGRNQNPWKEVNLPSLRARQGTPFIRRRSGGGTVYHDLGNTNFSIHLPRHSFDRHVTARIILRAVRSLGIDAEVNDRNDICVGKEKICLSFIFLSLGSFLLCIDFLVLNFYVSGSAYKIVNKRAYHHGTMLISTRLDTLGDLLRTSKETMLTKGVASVRSPVCNLQQFSSEITHETFLDAVVREFREEYGTADEAQLVTKDAYKDLDYIQRGITELPSWEWAYGQTPEFTYTVSQSFDWGNANVEIKSKHGIILECDIRVSDSLYQNIPVHSIKELEKLFSGKRYGFVQEEDLGSLVSSVPSAVLDIAHWVRSVMGT